MVDKIFYYNFAAQFVSYPFIRFSFWRLLKRAEI